jgi:DNA-directed RNA polymerase specialized sigma24 family protein
MRLLGARAPLPCYFRALAVIDFAAPSSVRVTKQIESKRTFSMLCMVAFWFTRSAPDAEDLVTDAVCEMCDPDDGRPWDPARGSLVAHARIVLHDLWRRERRRAQHRYEDLSPDAVRHARSPALTPEEVLFERQDTERMARRRDALVENVKDNPVAMGILACAAEEIGDAEAVAEKLGCTVEEVYGAKRVLKYQGKRILEGEGEE